MDENKGQNNIGHQVQKSGPSPLDVLKNAPAFGYFYRKCEKIVTALYMVTNLLSDKEPVKWKLRKLGTDTLSLSNKIKDTFASGREEVLYDVKSHILEIDSLLTIARFSGLMSEMNAEILRRELHSLSELFEERDFELNSGSLVIEKTFFSPSKQDDFVTASRQSGGRSAETHERVGSSAQSRERATAKPVVPSIKKTEKKSKRVEAILDTIRKKGTVTIKDISLNMSDVSEKTIQRELLSLVEKNVLKKEGERRWSRYSLV